MDIVGGGVGLGLRMRMACGSVEESAADYVDGGAEGDHGEVFESMAGRYVGNRAHVGPGVGGRVVGFDPVGDIRSGFSGAKSGEDPEIGK